MPVEKSSEQRQVALDDTVCTEQRQVAVNEPEGRVSDILVPSANSTTVPPNERMGEVSSVERLREITSQLQLLELERAAIITGGRNCTFPTEMPSSAPTIRYPPSTEPARQTTVSEPLLGSTNVSASRPYGMCFGVGASRDRLIVRATFDHTVNGAMTDTFTQGRMANASTRTTGRSVSFAMAGGPTPQMTDALPEETRWGSPTVLPAGLNYHRHTGSPSPERAYHSGNTFYDHAAQHTTLNASQASSRQATIRDLPPFSGAPEEWPMFISNYQRSTAMCGYSPDENLMRLQRALTGEAFEAVRYLLIAPSCLDDAIDLLRTLFGRPELIVHSLVRRVRRMPSPDAEHPQSLVKFSVAVLNICATVRACGMQEIECNATMLHEIVEKLPPTERLRWNDYRLDLTCVTLADLERWLKRLVRASSLSVTLDDPRGTAQNRRGQVSRLNAHNISSSTNTPPLPSTTKGHGCTICHDAGHKLPNCRKFIQLDVEGRWLIVRERGICRRCLNRHHNRCRIRTPCGKNGCRSPHHELLHDDMSEPSPIRTGKSCNTHTVGQSVVLFRYIPVTVYGKDVHIDTYAFFDEGSSSTFVEQGLVDELGLVGTPNPLCLRWTGETERQEDESHRLSLRVSGRGKRNQSYIMPKVHTLRSLALPEQTIAMSDLEERYPYLRGLPLTSYHNVKPRILIGIDNWDLGQPLRTANGDKNQPIVTKTRLGWTVFGPCHGSRQYRDTGNKFGSFHICACGSAGEDVLDQAVRNFFTLESIGVGPTITLRSKDDERALQLLSTETKQQGERFETCLLWKFDDVRLPSNRAMALRRYSCLRKRMEKDGELATAVKQKMIDYEQKGYIRRMSTEELERRGSRDWFLPIFPVANINKPGKIRMVFDAAAAVNGVSLNTYLLTGPQLLTSLLAVLYKFREFRIAVTGDIREMFHQVLIRPEDQRSQLIFWDHDDVKSTAPSVYAVTVMTFGAACSPSCAQYVKNLNANRFALESPRAAECIVQEHYVDDMLASVETEEEAVALAEEVRRIHARGGFEIRNWTSNSSAVVARLRGDQSASGLIINMGSDNHVEKVLGMWWDTTTDSFTFRLSPKHDASILSGKRLPSKREVLRTLMSIYDPLGLIGNFLVFLKILLQEIWRSGIDWDHQISGNVAEAWHRWLAVLPEVTKVKIPRCYRLLTSDRYEHAQLHIFCDASENAMATVAYFRFEEGNSIECAFVGSKTRVANLRHTSIPRLELQAAVLGSRLARSIRESHRIRIERVFYWTDSRNVVCWVRSDHRRYSQFVACRVGELLEHTIVKDWRWISTKINVADLGTKWQRDPNLDESSQWFRGPDFLWQPSETWPGQEVDAGETSEEVRVTLLHHATKEPLISFDRFSQWRTLLRTVGFIVRFVFDLRAKKDRKNGSPLTSEELQRAERIILRAIQHEAFSEDIKRLRSAGTSTGLKPVVNKDSSLHQLSPELDENLLLRSRGRLVGCPWISEDTKRPIILPRSHRVTTLLLEHYHQRHHHLNHQAAMNAIRERFHVPRLRSEFNRVRRRCQHCRIHHAAPVPPEMGNLPMERLAVHRRAFTFAGVDYFGPMTVAVGRRVEKRWGVLFTCLTTRAIHLEVAHSLTTSSCILAIRRFIAKRGAPVEILSDCGTNFVGASRELKESWRNVDRAQLMEEFTSPEMTWKFNPPGAPHFGGCWERLIQSVKKNIVALRLPRHPSDEILSTALAEIEMVINSRPLTYLSLDDISEPPLTPNHFLLGSPSGDSPPTIRDDSEAALKASWRTSQLLADMFWRKWTADYLPTLTRRTKWFKPVRPIEEGDVVVVVDASLPRNTWPRGRVVGVIRSKDGQVRRASVRTANGILERPATKLAVLDVSGGTSDI